MNDFISTTFTDTLWTWEQLRYQQLRHHHRGCCSQPTHTILKNDTRSPSSDVKGIISLSDVSGKQSPAISPQREGKLPACAAAQATGFTTLRHIQRRSEHWNKNTSLRKGEARVEKLGYCTAGVNAVKTNVDETKFTMTAGKHGESVLLLFKENGYDRDSRETRWYNKSHARQK